MVLLFNHVSFIKYLLLRLSRLAQVDRCLIFHHNRCRKRKHVLIECETSNGKKKHQTSEIASFESTISSVFFGKSSEINQKITRTVRSCQLRTKMIILSRLVSFSLLYVNPILLAETLHS